VQWDRCARAVGGAECAFGNREEERGRCGRARTGWVESSARSRSGWVSARARRLFVRDVVVVVVTILPEWCVLEPSCFLETGCCDYGQGGDGTLHQLLCV
jgi:hypothetical protein